MRIVTFVKYVPDAAGDRSFESDNTVDRETDGLLSELDEYAIEEALNLTDKDKGSETIALTVGPAEAKDAVRKSLQMGADKGVHVLDDAISGADAVGTAKILAAAVRKVEAEEGPVDLVITGLASTDGQMSVVPVMVAELLGRPAATQASALEVGDSSATIRRDGDVSSQHIEVALPALVSVTDQINEPRYPSFKGIMKAKKKPVAQYDLADLGLEAAEVGGAGALTQIVELAAAPARSAGEVVTDEGDGGTKLVEWLAAKKLV
ncbi:electron transfer flavoprotein subunit beta/FixA family protein [Brevibacterium album]|uniref:electron transfer flavoprotein subunit beta/FixA family protein n=1 Tax=Brevibacterium album TaxID=417948 RepID=UPI000406CE45|nr:electron transfer flavoprotein subunit beta/FixA family protein [Brevibacterium album]